MGFLKNLFNKDLKTLVQILATGNEQDMHRYLDAHVIDDATLIEALTRATQAPYPPGRLALVPRIRTPDADASWAPLLRAVFQANDKALLAALVDRGVVGDGAGAKGITTLGIAIELKDYGLIEKLLDRGLSPNALAAGSVTALGCAISNDDTTAVKLLLDRGANPNLPTVRTIHPITQTFGNHEILKALIAAGADPKLEPDILFIQLSSYDFQSVLALLEAGVRVNSIFTAMASAQVSPIYWAVALRDLRLVKLLDLFGADFKHLMMTPSGPADLVEFALNAHEENVTSLVDMTFEIGNRAGFAGFARRSQIRATWKAKRDASINWYIVTYVKKRVAGEWAAPANLAEIDSSPVHRSTDGVE